RSRCSGPRRPRRLGSGRRLDWGLINIQRYNSDSLKLPTGRTFAEPVSLARTAVEDQAAVFAKRRAVSRQEQRGLRAGREKSPAERAGFDGERRNGWVAAINDRGKGDYGATRRRMMAGESGEGFT